MVKRRINKGSREWQNCRFSDLGTNDPFHFPNSLKKYYKSSFNGKVYTDIEGNSYFAKFDFEVVKFSNWI
jgi:hypothetical protein